MDETVKVHCIDQEYWFIRRTGCSCGGRLKTQMQGYALRPAGPTDVISTRCESCGRGRTFSFDIGEFSGTFQDAMRLSRFLAEPRSEPLDERLKALIVKSVSPQMETTLEYLRKLAEARDDLALQYLEEAIQHFRQQASEPLAAGDPAPPTP